MSDDARQYVVCAKMLQLSWNTAVWYVDTAGIDGLDRWVSQRNMATKLSAFDAVMIVMKESSLANLHDIRVVEVVE